MTERVQLLLQFHTTRNFGTAKNLAARQVDARALYKELTPDEQTELATLVLSGGESLPDALCCLACFQPGSLLPFHERLVEQRIVHPGVIFHGAGDETVAALIGFLEATDRSIGVVERNHALVALAWIGNRRVQSQFARWREAPPHWASSLHVPPHQYSYEAGWELTQDNTRRNLFYERAYPLVASKDAADCGSLRIGVENEAYCPWCNHHLTALFTFDNLSTFLPGEPAQRVAVLTCHVCSCYGTIFGQPSSAGAVWHSANHKPAYLPEDASDWDAFPSSPLTWSGDTRGILESANWCLPGVAFSQIGGMPTWVQDATYPQCPDCSERMPFVGQICNEDFMQYGEGHYYAFRCPQCGVTATSYQQS